MPGTIQVSVLELMDLPPPPAPCLSEANSSFVSLKVAMGKREYQSVGGGDFSLPVTSFRENLILILLDTEGNLISQTEFKTRLIVEKGIWDDVFPLEGGGSVHMKLQFVLSEEERQRIREMRYSALKRKHTELLKGGCDSPVSEIKAEGGGFSWLKQMETDVSDLAGVDIENNKIQTVPGGVKDGPFSSCESLDPHIGYLGSSMSGNVSKDSISVSADSDDHICSPKRKNLQDRGLRSKVRKMISAFENSLSQGTGPHFGQGTILELSNIETGGSLKRTSSEESNIRELKFPHTMAKSFSAEMLSEIASQHDPNFIKSPSAKKQEGIQHFNNVTRQEMIGKDVSFGNFTVNKNFKSLKPNKHKSVKVTNDGSSPLESLQTAPSHNSKNIDTVSKPVKTEDVASFGGSAGHISKRIEPISVEKKINLDSFPKEGHSLVVYTAQKFPVEKSLNYNGEKLKALGARQKPFKTEQMASPCGSIRTVTEREDSVPIEVRKNTSIISKNIKSSAVEEKTKVNIFSREAHSLDAHTASRTFGEMSSSRSGVALEALRARDHTTKEINPSEEKANDDSGTTKQNESDLRCYRSHLEERIISGNSNESPELLSSYREKYLFGIFGVWEPCHLCITTGSIRLRNLVESDSLCRGTMPLEKKLLTSEANRKQKMHHEVTRNEKISCSSGKFNHENKVGNSNWNGVLIEQGVRIIIVIVACGTLLLNTR